MTHDGRWCCQTIFGRPDVARVTQLLEDGEWLQVVDRRLCLPPSVVGRLWRSYQEIEECTRRQGQGCSRMKTPIQGRFPVLLSRRNHMIAAKTLEIDFCRATEVHLPDQIVKNKSTTCPRPSSHCTTPCSAIQLFKFARQPQNWQIRHWRAHMRAVSLNQLMIDVLGCGDPGKKVTQTVTLSKFTGTMGAHHDVDRDSLGWSYIPVILAKLLLE